MVAAPDSAATACSRCTRTGECAPSPSSAKLPGRCPTPGDQPLKKSLPLFLASLVHTQQRPRLSVPGVAVPNGQLWLN